MPATNRLTAVLLAIVLATLTSATGKTVSVVWSGGYFARSFDAQQSSKEKEATKESQEEADEELAPAAVQLDTSGDSPLIKELYQATRETKEQAILAELSKAKELIESGSDIKSTDANGRTALHWAVFGSSYNTKPKIVVAYEEIADALVQRGVEINREDAYQDTALDYLLYSPNFEMQTLLIENGASSGFLPAFSPLLDEERADLPKPKQPVIPYRRTDLAAGSTLSVRLDFPVYSDRSRTGDPIQGTVTYPLCKDGEQVSCREGELLLPPGTKVNGTILFAQKAPDKYSRPRLVLDFSNVVHSDAQLSALYARVIDVDNARETIRNNEILGIVQPHASKKLSLAMAALSAANPIAGYTVKGVQSIYGLSIRREVFFPAGTDLQLQIVRPSALKRKESWTGWQTLPTDPKLSELVAKVPQRTATSKGTPSDLTNLMFLGSREQITSAFLEAGWFEADDIGVRSALKVAQATLRQTGYSSGPVSSLLINDRSPDLVFQKSLNTFAKRHHLRIWKTSEKYDGKEVWVGAATHDIATSNSRAGTKWSHRIDTHVDRERDWVATDLLFIGTATAYRDVERPGAPKKTTNATGDNILTDGKMSVLKLAAVKSGEEKSAPALTLRK